MVKVRIEKKKKKGEEEKCKNCFWQGSNLRPSACKADVITTTLQKRDENHRLNFTIPLVVIVIHPQFPELEVPVRSWRSCIQVCSISWIISQGKVSFLDRF